MHHDGFHMRIKTLIFVFLFCCGSLAVGQEPDINDLPRPEFHGLTQKQVTTLIFSRENHMIDKLSALRPITEAYVQSLGHRKAQGMDVSLSEESESVIDDLYFLAKVDFTDNGPEEKLLVGGGSWRNRYIKINSGALDQVYPLGMLMMFFADLYDFDADTYSLQYQGRQEVLDTECLAFSVVPVKERDSGKFRGQIWVESSSFSIVRLKGVFSGPYKSFFKALTGPQRFFHFDSVREKTDMGWLPSSTYFDERHSFGVDGNLEFHYRGYAIIWQQPHRPDDGSSPITSNAQNTSNRENPAVETAPHRLISTLEADGLLATPSAVEQHLDEIVAQFQPVDRTGVHIHCRVLLSTPAEIFPVGDTIVVSRGLLNLAPDDSVLAFMLARQAAHILLGHAARGQQFLESVFNEPGKKHSARLGIRMRPEQEASADAEAIVLLNGSPYKDAGVGARAFLSRLNSGSNRFPHLVRAEFGIGLLPESGALPENNGSAAAEIQELRFRNRYKVSWSRLIVDSEQHRSGTQVTILEEPATSTMSSAK